MGDAWLDEQTGNAVALSCPVPNGAGAPTTSAQMVYLCTPACDRRVTDEETSRQSRQPAPGTPERELGSNLALTARRSRSPSKPNPGTGSRLASLRCVDLSDSMFDHRLNLLRAARKPVVPSGSRSSAASSERAPNRRSPRRPPVSRTTSATSQD